MSAETTHARSSMDPAAMIPPDLCYCFDPTVVGSESGYEAEDMYLLKKQAGPNRSGNSSTLPPCLHLPGHCRRPHAWVRPPRRRRRAKPSSAIVTLRLRQRSSYPARRYATPSKPRTPPEVQYRGLYSYAELIFPRTVDSQMGSRCELTAYDLGHVDANHSYHPGLRGQLLALADSVRSSKTFRVEFFRLGSQETLTARSCPWIFCHPCNLLDTVCLQCPFL